MQYFLVSLEYPMFLHCFPFCFYFIHYTVYAKTCPWNIWRFYCAFSQLWGRDLENSGHQGTTSSWQMSSLVVLVWKQFTGCFLWAGQRLLFKNLPPSQLLVFWPLCKLEHDPSEEGNRSLLGKLGKHLLKERMVVILWIQIPRPTNFHFFFQAYGMDKETNKFSDLANFVIFFPSKNSFLKGKKKSLCLFKPWWFDSIVGTAGDLAKSFRRLGQMEKQIHMMTRYWYFIEHPGAGH